jgi:multicomponent Na+:H+ antiporter subunit B
MDSLILKVVSKFLLVLMLAFSIFILFRGHNNPGGGFIAGLIAACAFSLYVMANGAVATKRILSLDMRYWLAIGLFCCVGSGLLACFSGQPFLTAVWAEDYVMPVGSPVIFDIGVYLSVVATVLMIVFSLEEKLSK